MPIPSGFTVVPAPCAFGAAVEYVTGLFGPPAPGNRYTCIQFGIPEGPPVLALVKEVPLLAGTYLVQTVHNRGQNQDVAVTTSHWRWAASEDPVDTDFEIVESRLDGFWSALAAYRTTLYTDGEYRWYGPFEAPGPMGEAIRVVASADVAGTANLTGMPQQVACSFTEITDVRRRWGRFYIPGLVVGTMVTNAVDGLFSAGFIDVVADAGEAAFIQSNPNWRLVVFGAPLPTSLEVRSIRVDTVPDVIRRRRWDGGSSITRDISSP